MRTRLTEDEIAVKEVFDGFFANESPVEVVRSAEPAGHDPDLWAKLAATGAPGMANVSMYHLLSGRPPFEALLLTKKTTSSHAMVLRACLALIINP